MRELLRVIGHLVCFVIFVLLFGWILWSIRRLDSNLGVSLPAWTEIPGVVCIVAGAILMLLCAGVFIVRGKGTPFPLDPPQQLVVFGPYRYVRNPIHVGQASLFVGLGLYLHSPDVLLFAPAWFLFCFLYIVLIEERSLKKRFGASYEQYCKTVPRWVPTGLVSKRDG